VEDDALRPSAPALSPPLSTPGYDSIDDVPESVLQELVRRTLHASGATEDAGLIQYVARQLGFKRTGERIRTRIEKCLEALIQAGQIGRSADGRLQVAPTSRAVST
jgi:hypothetical protein